MTSMTRKIKKMYFAPSPPLKMCSGSATVLIAIPSTFSFPQFAIQNGQLVVEFNDTDPNFLTIKILFAYAKMVALNFLMGGGGLPIALLVK